MGQKIWEWGKPLAWVVLLIALTVSFFIYRGSAALLQNKKEAYFERETRRVVFGLEDRFKQYESVLRGSQAFFMASQSVSPEEFRRYVETLKLPENYPGLYGLGYISRVYPAEKEAYVKEMRQTLNRTFAIRPEGDRPFYFVLQYLERVDGDTEAVGFDLSTEEKRLHTLELTRDTGKIAISQKVILLQSKQHQEGFNVYAPLYQKDADVGSTVARNFNLTGWIYGLIRSDIMLPDLLKNYSDLIDVEVFEADVVSPSLLFDKDDVLRAFDESDEGRLSKVIPVRVGQQTWQVYMTTLPAFDSVMGGSRPILFALIGGGVSLLLFALVHLMASTRSRAMELANQMTAKFSRLSALQKSIVDSTNYAIISVDLNGMITTFNPAAEELLGYSADEVVGKETPMLFHDAGEVKKRRKEIEEESGRPLASDFEAFTYSAQRDIPETRDWTYIDKNGKRIPVMLAVTAIQTDSGELLGFVGIANDISARKEVDRMKNEFISTVSHELRTPLTSIRGSLGLILGGKAGEVPEKANSLLKIAANNCERLVRLINDILDIEKIESGKMDFKLTPLDLNALIQQAIDANRSYADTFSVKLQFDKPASTYRVRGDADKLLQVLTNLLSNAIKYSPAGEAVTVSVVRQGDQVRVLVTDRGPGIPEEFQKQIFQKFAQADSSDTRQKGGTGLGLAITRAIIETHGGKISFETRPARTTFYFDLPLMTELAELPKAKAAPTGAPRILICEDDVEVAHILKMTLNEGGFETQIVTNAKDAKECLKTQHYSGMTLDIMLPDQDGISLLRELRASERTHDLPIVVVSAVAASAQRELNGSAFKVVDWLEKPFDPARLLSAARAITSLDSRPHPVILHIEDDPDTRLVVQELLKESASIESVASVQEAKAALRRKKYALVILDLELPDGSGLDVLPLLHQGKDLTPVILFSANETEAAVSGLVSKALIKSKTSNEDLLNVIESTLKKKRT